MEGRWDVRRESATVASAKRMRMHAATAHGYSTINTQAIEKGTSNSNDAGKLTGLGKQLGKLVGKVYSVDLGFGRAC